MTLDELAAHAHELDAATAAGVPTLRLEEDADVDAVLAFFGADLSRGVARLVIRGDDAGYLERGDVLKWLRPRKLGWGDSDRAGLAGHVPDSSYRLYELECPVADCEESPIFVARYDQSRPPRCRIHGGEELRPSA
jgi:hypothetical protein